MAIQNGFNNVLLDDLTVDLGSDAAGDTYYRDSDGKFVRLGIGTPGQLLVAGENGLPIWQTGAPLTGNAGGDLAGEFPNPTIKGKAVTLPKIQDIASGMLLGRSSAGTGAIEQLTIAVIQAMLGLGSAAFANTGLGNGNVPVLDVNGKLNSLVIPAVSISSFYGFVANQAARLALTSAEVQPNDWVKQADTGISYVLTAANPSVEGNWVAIGDASIVASDIIAGVIATARLGTGTADGNTFLRGDQTWQALPFIPLPTTNVSGTAQAMSANNRYLANNANLVTLTLPATAAIGSSIQLCGVGVGGWRLAQNTGQQVHFGNKSSTVGTSGKLDSTHRRDCITLSCVVADSEWQVIGSIGNIDVV